MKKILLTGIFAMTTLLISAQNHEWCGTVRKFEEAVANDQNLQVQFDDFISWLQENQDAVIEAPEGGTYIVPVVVHVVHNYGVENISDAQIVDAINILNEDFNATSPDLSSVVPSFQSIIGNAGFEFRLARLDPNGNCTNGITRTVSAFTDEARDNAKVINWPRNMYYNMWIVRDIEESGSSQGVTAGYAYLPGSSPSSAVDGIILQHNYVGTIGTSTGSNFNKRVCSHETGHFFGLLHPWGWGQIGTTCSGTDFVSDTPPTQGNFSNCNLSSSNCGPLENVQNIMDYSSCTNMFTQGQVTNMTNAITSGTGQRSSLWQSANLIATGTNDGYIVQDCAPVCDFKSNFVGVCIGNTITFSDQSWNATPTSWSWTFTNGSSTQNSTLQNPTITFTEAGAYDVTLTVSGPGGNDTRTKTSMVYVFDNNAAFSTYQYEDKFDGNPIATGRWGIAYSQTPNNGWAETTQTYFSSNTCMMVQNYGGQAGNIYNLISPSYDFTQVPGPITMTFKHAFAKRYNQSYDVLKVYVSSNCGQTWNVRATYDADQLLTTSNKSTSWYPTPGSGSWTTTTLTNLTPFQNKTNVRFRFEFTSALGNNFFLDDINISGPLSVEDATKDEIGLNVYPNPAESQVNVNFLLDKDYQVQVNLMDISGRYIMTGTPQEYSAGDINVPLQLSGDVQSGLYMVEILIGNKRYVERLIVK